MHIHANNNLALAALGAGREEVSEIQARRAAEVRRKLSSAARLMEDSGDILGPASRVTRRSYEESAEGEPGEGEDGAFGRLFSAKA
jgi:hypothetical protein